MRRPVGIVAAALVAALCVTGYLRWRSGRPASAATSELMARTLENPGDADAQAILADRLMRENRPSEAATAYAAAARLRPEDSTLVVRETRALLRAGNRAEALALARETLASRPKDAPAGIAAGEMDLALGNYLSAAERFRAALAARPHDSDALAGLSYALAESHEHTAAIEAARRAVAASPDNGRAHLALGHALFLSGDARNATAPLQSAVELDPRDVAAWELLCGATVQSALTEGEFAAAADVLAKAASAAPGSAQIAYYQGLLQMSRRQYPDAAASFRRALELNPVYVDALYNLANALALSGRAAESASVRKQFVRISDYSRAATDLQVRLQRDPGKRDLWLRLLRLAEQNGDSIRAAYCRSRLQ